MVAASYDGFSASERAAYRLQHVCALCTRSECGTDLGTRTLLTYLCDRRARMHLSGSHYPTDPLHWGLGRRLRNLRGRGGLGLLSSPISHSAYLCALPPEFRHY